MSSHGVTDGVTDDVDKSVEPVSSSESVTLSDEQRDMVDGLATEEPNSEGAAKHKWEHTSEVWKYFVAKEVNEKGKMVQKLECMYCKKRYKGMMGGPTTTFKRHIETCANIKKAQDNSQGLLKFESCDNTVVPGLNPSGVIN